MDDQRVRNLLLSIDEELRAVLDLKEDHPLRRASNARTIIDDALNEIQDRENRREYEDLTSPETNPGDPRHPGDPGSRG